MRWGWSIIMYIATYWPRLHGECQMVVAARKWPRCTIAREQCWAWNHMILSKVYACWCHGSPVNCWLLIIPSHAARRSFKRCQTHHATWWETSACVASCASTGGKFRRHSAGGSLEIWWFAMENSPFIRWCSDVPIQTSICILCIEREREVNFQGLENCPRNFQGPGFGGIGYIDTFR